MKGQVPQTKVSKSHAKESGIITLYKLNWGNLMEFNVFRVLQRYVLLFLLLIPGKSLPLGLGDATVESLLDYPLRVKIELLAVSAEELAGLSTQLASSRDFDWVGIERTKILDQLEFSAPKMEGSSVYFTVTSKAPIHEPVLNFLVEAKWPAGRLLREYTIKLQPANISKIRQTVENAVQPPEPAGEIKPILEFDENASFAQTDTAPTGNEITDPYPVIRCLPSPKISCQNPLPTTRLTAIA